MQSVQPPIATLGRACPGCGSVEHILFAAEHLDAGKVSEFTYASRKAPEYMCLKLVTCLRCDLVYAPNPPGANFLSESYADAAYDSVVEANCAAGSYIRALAVRLRSLESRSAAVDVGAGSGPLLPLLRQQGFREVIGIEPSRAAIDAATAEARPMLKEGMFSPAMLHGVTPALICSFMTLEHLDEPGSFAKMAHDLLEPRGMVAIVVHNRRGLLNRVLGMKSPIIDVEHLQLFSPRSISVLLARSGFDDVHVRSIWNSYPIRYWLRLTPLPPKIKNTIAAILEKIKLADIKISLPVGNILATARKPSPEHS